MDDGSSPRMRGTPELLQVNNTGRRIIPAYAGNASHWKKSEYPPSDHPRVCGERWLPIAEMTCTAGSSPRMRGTRLHIAAGIL